MLRTASGPPATLLVIAKAPVAGRAKTRLCPPLSPAQAAELAEAALFDTLSAVAATQAPRRLLVLEGRLERAVPAGIQTVAQERGEFAQRLAAAFAIAKGPALLIGMDTPQITVELLEDALMALGTEGIDAVIGDADDGGYWAIGLRVADPAVFRGIPMSTGGTGALQRARLEDLGLRVARLPSLRDVDEYDDALAVAAAAPHTRFARCLEKLPPGALEAAA